MKRTRLSSPLPLGRFVAETWRIPIKPERRAVRSSGANSRRNLVVPGEQQLIVCSFCGNSIRVVFCPTLATPNKGVRR